MTKLIDFSTILAINASEMPDDVENYCIVREISTHCDNDLTFIENNDNPFANWLRRSGYKFQNEEGDWIGIFAT